MLQWTWECRYLFEIPFSFPLGIYPEMELLDHMIILYFNFLGTSMLFSIVIRPICIPTKSAQRSPFLHTLANTYHLSFWLSVWFGHPVVSNSLQPHGLQHAGFPVHHQLLEHAQTNVHRVSDAIQPSHPLWAPSRAFNLPQHQGLFQGVSSSHQVAKVL